MPLYDSRNRCSLSLLFTTPGSFVRNSRIIARNPNFQTRNSNKMLSFIDTLQDFLWTYIVIVMLIGCAVFFTVRTGFVQFRLLGEMLRLMMSSNDKNHAGNTQHSIKHISSFQAFVVALASRIGTGNLAGVATAISVGGPGAVFWMWIMAVFGAATAFVESTLAQLYKRRGKDSFFGGPAYYMKYGLGKRWMGVVFSVLMIITFGLANNAMQGNAISAAWQKAFGIETVYMGMLLMALTLLIIFGGIHRIARVSSAVVPVMAVAYMLLAVCVVILNITALPDVLVLIIRNAFGMEQVAGGGLGTVVMQGIKRGLFSNEAGEGSAPNAAATATVSHPVKQGLVQALGVFCDTLVVCSCTAFIILCSGVDIHASDGINLTQDALSNVIGTAFGNPFIAVAIWLFAFSSIIANYYYGETNLAFFTRSRTALFVYRMLSAGFVLIGSIMTLTAAWSMIDLCMALITICNLIAITMLFPQVRSLVRDYISQRRQGKSPVFHRDTMPEVKQHLDAWE